MFLKAGKVFKLNCRIIKKRSSITLLRDAWQSLKCSLLLSLGLKDGRYLYKPPPYQYQLHIPPELEDITLTGTHPHEACSHLCWGDDDGTME